MLVHFNLTFWLSIYILAYLLGWTILISILKKLCLFKCTGSHKKIISCTPFAITLQYKYLDSFEGGDRRLVWFCDRFCLKLSAVLCDDTYRPVLKRRM